jgi:hypothetical protein
MKAYRGVEVWLDGSLISALVSGGEPGYLSRIAPDYWLDDRGFESCQRLGIFLFTTASSGALGPTQPPIQWVPGALYLGVKRPESEADHSPPSISEVKECVKLYLHSPNTPLRCRAQSKWQGQLYLYLYPVYKLHEVSNPANLILRKLFFTCVL